MDIFIDLFRNPLIIDSIKTFLPNGPQNNYKLPNTYLFKGSGIKHLDYDEFFIYCAFLFRQEHCLYQYNEEDIIQVLSQKKLLDIIVEENQFSILKRIYYKYNLKSKIEEVENGDIIYYENKFTTTRSLYSAIKHNNLKMLKFLNNNYKTIYWNDIDYTNKYHLFSNNYIRYARIIHKSNKNVFNIPWRLQFTCVKLLTFAMSVGHLNIVKYICLRINNPINFFDSDDLELQIALEKAIRNNHIHCALFLIDYFKIVTNNRKWPQISTSTNDKIRIKCDIIHKFLFNKYQYETDLIDWWYVIYHSKKINVNCYVSIIKNLSISTHEKARKLIIFLSRLEKIYYLNEKCRVLNTSQLDNLNNILMGVPINTSTNNQEDEESNLYYSNSIKKLDIINNIINNIFYQPYIYHKTVDINLYDNLYKIYNMINI